MHHTNPVSVSKFIYNNVNGDAAHDRLVHRVVETGAKLAQAESQVDRLRDDFRAARLELSNYRENAR